MVKLFGIIALAAVIGFSMASCGGDDHSADSALNGTWLGAGTTMTLDNGKFELEGQAKGSYTTSGDKITINITHFKSGSDWIAVTSEVKDLLKLVLAQVAGDEGGDMLSGLNADNPTNMTGKYKITGNQLTLTLDGQPPQTFTKK